MITIAKKKRQRYSKPVYEGVKWDSKLELNHYKELKEHEDIIEVVDRQKQFIMYNPFKYTDFPLGKERSFGKISYKPDFILKVKGYDKLIAMESKGYPRPVYQLRKKLFIKEFKDEYYFYECGSLKQLKSDIEEMRVKVNE